MPLSNILSEDRTFCAVSCQSKKKILERVSEIASQYYVDIPQATILSSLVQRERMGSTGIGHGVAIPHARLSDIDEVIAIVLTTETPIAFDAIDNQPVDIFFALLVPEDQISGHLQTLAGIAAKLNDKTILKQLRKATSSEAMVSVLLSDEHA